MINTDSNNNGGKEDTLLNLCQTTPKTKPISKITDQNGLSESKSFSSLSFDHSSSSIPSPFRKSSLIVVVSFWKSFRGVLFTALATLFFAINASIAKHLNVIDPSLIALFRYGGTMVLSTPTLRKATLEEVFGPADCRIWIVFRALSGSMAMYLRYATVQLLPLANVSYFDDELSLHKCFLYRLS